MKKTFNAGHPSLRLCLAVDLHIFYSEERWMTLTTRRLTTCKTVKVKFDLWWFSLRFQSTHIPLIIEIVIQNVTISIQIGVVVRSIEIAVRELWLKTSRFQNRDVFNLRDGRIVEYAPLKLQCANLDWNCNVFNHDFNREHFRSGIWVDWNRNENHHKSNFTVSHTQSAVGLGYFPSL